MESFIYPLPADEFTLLDPLSISDLASQMETVRGDLERYELWLASPPSSATEGDIQTHLSFWDTCRQWFFAYESALLAREQTPTGGAVGGARSSIQRQLDAEWESANHSGPGCPFCDATTSCDCWARRREMMEAEERRRRAEERALVAQGKCACHLMPEDAHYMCDHCEKMEELSCDCCGKLQCSAGCCGGCGACSRCSGPACSRCGGFGDCGCYDDREESECEEERYSRWKREYWESGH